MADGIKCFRDIQKDTGAIFFGFECCNRIMELQFAGFKVKNKHQLLHLSNFLVIHYKLINKISIQKIKIK